MGYLPEADWALQDDRYLLESLQCLTQKSLLRSALGNCVWHSQNGSNKLTCFHRGMIGVIQPAFTKVEALHRTSYEVNFYSEGLF